MKIAVIASEFYPSIGGIGQNFNNMCKVFRNNKEHTLYIFNHFYKGKNIFDVLDKNRYSLKDLHIILKNRRLYYFFLLIWKILIKKKIRTSFKLKMILYLLIRLRDTLKILTNISSIYPYLNKINADIIMGSDCSGSMVPLVFLFSQIFHKKGICYGHGTDFLVHSHWSLKSYFLRLLNKIILSNKKMKELIKKINHLEEDQLTIIPYGLYLDNYKIQESKKQLREKLGLPLDEFIIISVGRHAPRKNFEMVIEAMKILKENHTNKKFKYLLIGHGSETPRLKELVIDLHLKDDVVFLGGFSGMRKNEFIKASDVLVMPSIATNKTVEGFGIVFLEANFYKIPVIGTRSGGIIEAIHHNKSGLLINNLNELVKAILYLYDNEEERKRMGEYGHNRVINKYNWKLLVNEYIKVFEDIRKE